MKTPVSTEKLIVFFMLIASILIGILVVEDKYICIDRILEKFIRLYEIRPLLEPK